MPWNINTQKHTHMWQYREKKYHSIDSKEKTTTTTTFGDNENSENKQKQNRRKQNMKHRNTNRTANIPHHTIPYTEKMREWESEWETSTHKQSNTHTKMDNERRFWTILIMILLVNKWMLIATHWEPYFKHISEFELNTFVNSILLFLLFYHIYTLKISSARKVNLEQTG